MMFTTKVVMWVFDLSPAYNAYNQEGRSQPAYRKAGTP
jgi:hypothetical protein